MSAARPQAVMNSNNNVWNEFTADNKRPVEVNQRRFIGAANEPRPRGQAPEQSATRAGANRHAQMACQLAGDALELVLHGEGVRRQRGRSGH